MRLLEYSQDFASISTIHCGRFLSSLMETQHSFSYSPQRLPPPPSAGSLFLPRVGAVSLGLVEPHVLFLGCIQAIGSSLERCTLNEGKFGSGTVCACHPLDGLAVPHSFAVRPPCPLALPELFLVLSFSRGADCAGESNFLVDSGQQGCKVRKVAALL